MNCQSARNKSYALINYIEENEFDITCLQETWLNSGDQNIYQLFKEYDYKLFKHERNGVQGGGILILSKPNLCLKRVNIDKNLTFNSFEYVCCSMPWKDTLINIVSMYRPPYSTRNKCTVKTFLEQFESFLSNLLELRGYPLILGDININVCGKKDANVKKFLKILEDNNLVQLCKLKTHEKGGTLDLVITDNEIQETITSLVTDTTFTTDHFPIKLTLAGKENLKKSVCVKQIRELSNLDNDAIIENLKFESVTDKNKFCNLSATSALQLYNSNMESFLNKHCPITLKRYRPNRTKSMWYNSFLQKMKQVKRRQERRYKKHPSLENKTKLIKARNQYIFEIKQTREDYYRKKITTCNKDSKQLSKVLRKITGSTAEKFIPTNDENSVTCEKMADFYVKKISDIRNEMINDGDFNMNRPVCKGGFLNKFNTIDSNQLRKIIISTKNKTCQSDPIPTKFVKKSLNHLIPIFLHIINSSIQEKIFPDLLKNAILTPIIKDPSKSHEEYKNYRPVSNLPFLSKVLEKVMYHQLNKHIEENNFHCKYQSAYRKNYSCETSVLRLIGDIEKMLNEKSCVLLVLLDSTAAFDTIDHEILYKQLEEEFNVSSDALEMIKSYLTNRSFSVAIKDKIGNPRSLNYGVPQGSVLAPLLYALYTKPMETIAKNHGFEVNIYADDCQIYIKFDKTCSNTIGRKIEQCIQSIKSWMTKNFLKLNPEKTMMKVFTPRGISLDSNLNLSVTPLPSVKVLGVVLGGEMNFKEFISKKFQTCHYHLRNLRNIKNCLSQETRILLVNNLILSTLDFCNSILINLPACSINPLQKILNKSVRFICDVRLREHITPYLRKLHFLPLKFRIMFKGCLIGFKIIREIAPEYLRDNFKLFQPNLLRNLRYGVGRDKSMFEITLEEMKNPTVLIRIALTWNDLPLDLRVEQDLETFKTKLKTHYFRAAYGD